MGQKPEGVALAGAAVVGKLMGIVKALAAAAAAAAVVVVEAFVAAVGGFAAAEEAFAVAGLVVVAVETADASLDEAWEQLGGWSHGDFPVSQLHLVQSAQRLTGPCSLFPFCQHLAEMGQTLLDALQPAWK